MNIQGNGEALMSRFAIRELLDRYTNALNHRDWSALEALFTADGVWDATAPMEGAGSFHFEGAGNCARGIAALVEPAEVCIQSNHAVVIEVNGGSATAVSTINEVILMQPLPGVLTVWGNYYDTLTLAPEGSWRFKERRFRVTWSDLSSSRGQVLRRFPLG